MTDSDRVDRTSLLAQLVAALPDALFVFDTRACIVEANPFASQLLGYDHAALRTMSLEDIAPDFARAAARAQWGQLGAGQQANWIGRVQRSDGGLIQAEICIVLMDMPGERLYAATVRDHLDRQALLRALHENEKRFRLATGAARVGVFTGNVSIGAVYWSRELRSIVGVAEDFVPGTFTVMPTFVHPEDTAVVWEKVMQACDPAGAHQFDFSFRIVRPQDGAVRWVQIIGQVSFDWDGQRRRPGEISGLLMDVTESKQLKLDLALSQQRFALALHSSSIMFFEQDRDLRYTWLHNSQFGIPAESILHKFDSDVLAPNSATALVAMKRQVLETGTRVRRELEVEVPGGGSKYMDFSVEPRRDVGGRIVGVIGTASDVDEACKAKISLESLNVELKLRTREVEAANEMRAQFLSMVSHELRTPLHTLLGYVRLALNGSEGEIHAHLEIVERSGRQLMKQIGDLLSFNRNDQQLGSLQFESVRLQDLVEQISRTGHMLAVSGENQFSVQVPCALPPVVRVDAYRLLQVLDNLIGNACKYTDHGSVTLVIQRLCASGSYEDEPGGRSRIQFSVEDTGIGISQEDLPHIFEPFVRARQTQFMPGLGLGLSIARQWVRAMGGDIQVESRWGQGSRFWFALDLQRVWDTDPTSACICAVHQEPGPTTRQTILVVDDAAENRTLLRRVLEKWGYQVVEADSGVQALAVFEAHAQTMDALVVDQFMPDMDGWALLHRLRMRPIARRVPVVLVSASPPQRPDSFPTDLAFDLELEKPLDFQRLACFLCFWLKRVEHTPEHCKVLSEPISVLPHKPLPRAELDQLNHLLRMGRVLRIGEWARQLRQRDADFSALSDRVAGLAAAADLEALNGLVQQLEALAGLHKPSL